MPDAKQHRVVLRSNDPDVVLFKPLEENWMTVKDCNHDDDRNTIVFYDGHLYSVGHDAVGDDFSFTCLCKVHPEKLNLYSVPVSLAWCKQQIERDRERWRQLNERRKKQKAEDFKSTLAIAPLIVVGVAVTFLFLAIIGSCGPTPPMMPH